MADISLTQWWQNFEGVLQSVGRLGLSEETLSALQQERAYQAAVELCHEGKKLEDFKYPTIALRGETLTSISNKMRTLAEQLGQKVKNDHKKEFYHTKYMYRPIINSSQSLVLGVLYFHHLDSYQHVETTRTSTPYFQAGVNDAKRPTTVNCELVRTDIRAFLSSFETQEQRIELINQLGVNFYTTAMQKFSELPEAQISQDVAEAIRLTPSLLVEADEQEPEDDEFFDAYENFHIEDGLNGFIRQQLSNVFAAIPSGHESAQQRLTEFNVKLHTLVKSCKEIALLKQYSECLDEAQEKHYTFKQFQERFQFGRVTGYERHAGLINEINMLEHSHAPSLKQIEASSQVYESAVEAAAIEEARLETWHGGWLNYKTYRHKATVPNFEPLNDWYAKTGTEVKHLIAERTQTFRETIGEVGNEITAQDFIDRPSADLHNLTAKLCHIEALTAASGEIDKFIERHHQPIITFISWGILGKITDLMSRVKPLSYFINDKYLLFKEAQAFKKDIENVKQQLQALNNPHDIRARSEARESMNSLVTKAANVETSASRIKQSSCYLFWRSKNIEAAREQKAFASTCHSTFSQLSRTI